MNSTPIFTLEIGDYKAEWSPWLFSVYTPVSAKQWTHSKDLNHVLGIDSDTDSGVIVDLADDDTVIAVECLLGDGDNNERAATDMMITALDKLGLL